MPLELLIAHNYEREELEKATATIAVEGPVCSGKSTLLETIKQKTSSGIIDEYMLYQDFVGRTSFMFPPRDVSQAKENFLSFMKIEKLRKSDYDSLSRKVRYIDRSIYTLLAFELGSYFFTGIDIFEWALDHSMEASNKDIIIPDHVLYLDVSRKAALERARAAGMKTLSFLFSDQFNSSFRSFFIALNQVRPGYVTFVNTDRNRSAIYQECEETVNQYLESKSLSAGTKPLGGSIFK